MSLNPSQFLSFTHLQRGSSHYLWQEGGFNARKMDFESSLTVMGVGRMGVGTASDYHISTTPAAYDGCSFI